MLLWLVDFGLYVRCCPINKFCCATIESGMLEIHSTPKEEKEGRAARLAFYVQGLTLTLSKPDNALLPSLVKGRKINNCLTINQINQLVIAKTRTAEK